MVDIRDVGPGPDNFIGATAKRGGAGRMLCLTASSEGKRLYAGSFSGVWRSDDAGRNWRQMTRPQPGGHDPDVPGALYAPYIIDIAVSPRDPNIVLAAATASMFIAQRNGVYRSTDGGSHWTLVLSLSGGQRVSQVVFAPDDPDLAMAPLGQFMGISHDGGATWSQSRVVATSSQRAWHVAIAPLEASGVRRVYAAGDGQIWRSIDAGASWSADQGAAIIKDSRDATSAFIVASGGGALPPIAQATGTALSPGAQALAIAPDNPQHVYLAAHQGTLGPSYFAIKDGVHIPDGTTCNTTPDRLAGESSIWFGDYTDFDTNQRARWETVPGPPVYWGASTPSGKVFVSTKPTPTGYVVFFADTSHVHMCVGRPTRTSLWRRLDGRSIAEAKRLNVLSNHLSVHPDPHALVTTGNFNLTTRRVTDVPSPYNDCSELDAHLGGTILMANDGGVVWSDDGGETWTPSRGLHTVDVINIAGLAKPGKPPALYFGGADNDSFFTTDGGAKWRDCAVHLGDADAWFADIADGKRVLQFTPRAAGLNLWFGDYPNAAGAIHDIPTPRFVSAQQGPNNAVSPFVKAGSSPMIRTLTTEPAPADGDYIVILQRIDGSLALKRTLKLSTINAQEDWEDPAIAPQIGPDLPAGAVVAKAAGGHAKPDFYVSNNQMVGGGAKLWKLDPTANMWREIVPGGPPGESAQSVRRFWVDPFNADLIYLLDFDRVRVSVDGGARWMEDAGLTQAITGNRKLSFTTPGGLASNTDILRDMLFVRSDRRLRFAFGAVGALYTIDGGLTWQTLYNAIALPGLPETGFYDGISDPHDPALYVVVEGRGILRLSGFDLPAPLFPPHGDALLDIIPILHEA